MTHTVSRIISDQTLSRIIQIESAGNPNAKARTSSATGLGQFLDGTWMKVVKQHRPDLLEGRTRAQVLALRTDPPTAVEMLARFTEDNARSLGAGYTDGDLYLAHFSGLGAARKLLRSEAGASTTTCYDEKAIAANRSILEGKTVGEVREWAARKMRSAGKTNWVARHCGDSAPPAKPKPIERDDTAPPHELDAIQRKLQWFGYYEVGEPDGKWGGRTAAAIAAYKNDRRLSGPPAIDEPLKRDMMDAELEQWKRPIAESRKTATDDKVAEISDAVPAAKQNGILAWILGIPASFLAVFQGIAAYFKELWDSDVVTAAREFASDNLGLICAAVALIAFHQWWTAHRAKEATKEAFRTGRLT